MLLRSKRSRLRQAGVGLNLHGLGVPGIPLFFGQPLIFTPRP
jgi:hypothetical protein